MGLPQDGDISLKKSLQATIGDRSCRRQVPNRLDWSATASGTSDAFLLQFVAAMNMTQWMDEAFYPSHEDQWDNKRFRLVLESAIEADWSVLDYGAGRGALEEMNFKGRARFVAGVDPDQAVLGNPHLDEARILSMPGARIPYPDGSFDLVYSNNVLEHVPDPLATLREVERVLKPGGSFVAKTPNKAHYVPLVAMLTPHIFHEFVSKLRGRGAHDTFPTLYRCNTPRRVTKLARQAGLALSSIAMWEGRPEYLRMAMPLYLAGYAYERVVNVSDLFSGLRCVMVCTLRKLQ